MSDYIISDSVADNSMVSGAESTTLGPADTANLTSSIDALNLNADNSGPATTGGAGGGFLPKL